MHVEDLVEDADDATRQELVRWFELRQRLISDRIRQEVDKKMKDCAQACCSTPFLRVSVATPGETAEPKQIAILTIWNPCEEQLEFLKEGAILQMKGLVVKDKDFGGFRQLSGNSKTSIAVAPPCRSEEATARSCCLSPFQLHAESKRIATKERGTLCRPIKTVDVIGFAVAVDRSFGLGKVKFTLSDRSRLTVEVEYGEYLDSAAQSMIDKLATEVANDVFPMITLIGAELQPFDSIEKVVRVRMMPSSSVKFQRQDSAWAVRQLSWSTTKQGQLQLLRVARSISARLPLVDAANSRVAVGYLCGLYVRTDQQLFVKVDSGMDTLHTWTLPLSLINCLVNDPENQVALNRCEELRVTQLRSMARAFRARRTLYRFKIVLLDSRAEKSLGCKFEVSAIAPVDTEGLCKYYECLRLPYW